MNVQHLVTMANDIAGFFDVEADKRHATEQVSNHIARYWEKRMRTAIIAHVQAGGAGLSPLARNGIALLKG